jgi:hypothetical protein
MVVDHKFCIDRLVREHKQHGSFIVAFDFDNTVYDYHKQGLDMTRVYSVIRKAKLKGLELMCFTANEDHEFVSKFCKENLGIEDVAINQSSLDYLFNSRKPFYSILLDDRAGLCSSLYILEQVLGKI